MPVQRTAGSAIALMNVPLESQPRGVDRKAQRKDTVRDNWSGLKKLAGAEGIETKATIKWREDGATMYFTVANPKTAAILEEIFTTEEAMDNCSLVDRKPGGNLSMEGTPVRIFVAAEW